jgi:hypothetical protein
MFLVINLSNFSSGVWILFLELAVIFMLWGTIGWNLSGKVYKTIPKVIY